MRGLWIWIGAIAAGLATVLVVVALIGNSDNSGDTVPASQWADGVCASVAVWRGEMEAIVEDIRTPPSVGSSSEEPQSETPQGRTGFIREGLTRAVRATQILVISVDNLGTPDTANGDEADSLVTTWVGDALGDLERAETSLARESETLEESVEQLTEAAEQSPRLLRAARRPSSTSRRSIPRSALLCRARKSANFYARSRAAHDHV